VCVCVCMRERLKLIDPTFILFIERERARVSTVGEEGQRERKGKNLKQAPRPEPKSSWMLS